MIPQAFLKTFLRVPILNAPLNVPLKRGDSPTPPPRRKVFSWVGARGPRAEDLKGASLHCGLSDSLRSGRQPA